jgi:SAM-dependent methyltransferase
VKALYQDTKVAEDYIQDRFTWSWSRLLHDRQVRILNETIRKHGIRRALELAPGPARLSTQVEGLERGLAVEASAEMLEVARRRVKEKGLEKVWELREGNAFDLSSVEETFGLVYTFRFVRHFAVEERERLYREILARLEPSGLLVFDVVNRPVTERLRAKKDGRARQSRGEDARREEPGDERAENAGAGEYQSLPVYDALYTEDELRAEMDAAGFDVVSLRPILRHFELQAWISYRGDARLRALSNLVVRLLEAVPGGAPLEWVAVVRKRG